MAHRGWIILAALGGLGGCAETPVPLEGSPDTAPPELADGDVLPDTKLVRTADPIPGRYIVVLKGAARQRQMAAPDAALDATITRLADAHAATVANRFGAALRGFS